MITFEQVTKRYGERLALDSVSWRMDEGECVVFLGPSGAGKTTVLRLVTHEISPSAGIVTVGTFRGSRLSRARRALLRRTLGVIYEDFRLLADRTVFENVALAVRIAGRFADADVAPRVMLALAEVGLPDKQDAFPAELSAGERQRAAIARAIVNRPAVVLADEPTGALEARSAREVLDLLGRVHEEGAALIVATTRDEVAEALGGRVLGLVDGRLVTGERESVPAPVDPGPEVVVVGDARPAAPDRVPPGAPPVTPPAARDPASPGAQPGSEAVELYDPPSAPDPASPGAP